MFAQIGIEALATCGFNGQSGPVCADAIFPLFTRIEQQGGDEGGFGAGCRRSGGSTCADHIRAHKLIAKARCVGEQMAKRDRALGRAQLDRAVRIETFDHLRIGQLRQKRIERRIQRQLAALYQLQGGDRDDGFRHRRDLKQIVGLHRRAIQTAGAKCAGVMDTITPPRHRNGTGHVCCINGSAQFSISLHVSTLRPKLGDTISYSQRSSRRRGIISRATGTTVPSTSVSSAVRPIRRTEATAVRDTHQLRCTCTP